MNDYFELLENPLKSAQNKSKIVEIFELHAAQKRLRVLEDFDMEFSRRCTLLQPCFFLQFSCVS